MEAREIQSRMAQAYASFQSFQDHGTQTTTNIRLNGFYQDRTEVMEFSLRFVRPYAILAEEAERSLRPECEPRRNVIWTREGKAYRWSTTRADEHPRPRPLGMAMTTTHVVLQLLALLLPSEVICRRLTTIESQILGEETLDHQVCWKLAFGGQHLSSVRTAWVDRRSFVLRRIQATTEHSPESLRALIELRKKETAAGSLIPEIEACLNAASREEFTYTTVTTTDFHPEIDPPLDPVELDFTPP